MYACGLGLLPKPRGVSADYALEDRLEFQARPLEAVAVTFPSWGAREVQRWLKINLRTPGRTWLGHFVAAWRTSARTWSHSHNAQLCSACTKLTQEGAPRFGSRKEG